MWESAGWICGGGVLIVVIGLIITYFVSSRMMAKEQERYEREGDLQMCWISSAGKELYEVHNVSGVGEARVVFLMDDVANRKGILKDLTARLTNGVRADGNVHPIEVNAFFNKINEQTWVDPPERMPEWLVGEFEAYTAMMQVYWRKLPEMKLTKPYIYGRVILGDGGGVRHVPYPEKKSRKESDA